VAPRKHPGVIVRTNGDGTRSYEARWRQGGGRTGRRFSHTFDKQTAAVDALTRIRAAGSVCHCPKHAPPGATPTSHYGPASPGEQPAGQPAPQFGDYARAHIDAKTGIGKGYRRQLRRDLDRHLAPFLPRPWTRSPTGKCGSGSAAWRRPLRAELSVHFASPTL